MCNVHYRIDPGVLKMKRVGPPEIGQYIEDWGVSGLQTPLRISNKSDCIKAQKQSSFDDTLGENHANHPSIRR